MRHVPNEIRTEAKIRWSDVWKEIGVTRFRRQKILVRDLRKRELMIAARDGGHWLTEVALLESMRRVRPLQTHLEDFVPAPQQPAAVAP